MVSFRARLLNLMLRSIFKPRAQQLFRTNPPITEELRHQLMETVLVVPKTPSDVSIETLSGGEINGEWVSTTNSLPNRAILFFHGGGYVMGASERHRDFNWRLAKVSRAKVFSVDYRLAPEHPFPAALQDALAAWQWLLEQGFNPENIIISGDSAGGGLSLATMLSLRDAGSPLPAAAALFSPWTDLSISGESADFNSRYDPFTIPRIISLMAAAYTSNDTDLRHPLVSPLFGDLTGMPPLCLHVGSTEVLLSDSTRLAEKAEAANVNVMLKVWHAMPHIFHLCACCLPEGRKVIEEVGAFANAHFGE
ncbi:MAG: Acetyl esterase/lipase [Candidatus Kentron sp. G]|nr:MAG: Acetyl esterase/lipase [Candidatus Kentron sp. G]VFM98775.1 MAG: Acetyl esterase/lipase [Candidatus Kentron sp. G]VFN00577.1 MAG: Acetyl esterase/lipase [Candidatus Kentron sp. G]